MFNKFKTWIMSSNRYKHAIVGGILLVILMGLFAILHTNFWISLIMTNVCVALCMATAEYKDKLHGGLFDLEDIIAGMIIPCSVLIISLLFLIF